MREFTVTMTKRYQITITAEDWDEAIDIAENIPLSDSGWDFVDVDFEAEGE
jgi:hypothetical protein